VSAILFSTEHSWIKQLDDGTALVGISDYAQEQLGDIVFVEAPEVGRDFVVDEEVGTIESVKTNGELCAPATGSVLEINRAVIDAPELINESALDDGWIFRMRVDDPDALQELMGEDDYADFIDGLE
jgi:glycine cleavage system H protein